MEKKDSPNAGVQIVLCNFPAFRRPTQGAGFAASSDALCSLAGSMANTGKTFVVEHLDGELGPWSELEYVAIANETRDAKSTFVLSGLPHQLQLPLSLTQNPAFKAEGRAVEELYAAQFPSICLLDPSASQDLSPEDGDKFDIFLFGGILGNLFCAPVLLSAY